LAAIFDPTAFKILLTVDEEVGAQRNFDDLEKNPNRLVESGVKTVKELLDKNRHRVASEKARYQKLYQVDHLDHKHYDLIIDSTNRTEDEVFQIAEFSFNTWSKGLPIRKMAH
jgi:cytidylate kinase